MNLGNLNPEQRQAVEAPDGPVLIVAGPGSGKTKTLTTRIAYLLASARAKPEQILALTFTNKAAREMSERLANMLTGAGVPKVCTFHALAASLVPTGDKKLISDAERQAVLKQVKKLGSVSDLNLMVSKAKNQLGELAAPDQQLLAAYNAELSARNLYDFDDLLLQLRQYLQDHRTPYTHILVDEFQDTNELQYELIKLLNHTNNLFVIGDPLQSIYGFRGASAKVFERFRQDWPGAVAIWLGINYRSTAPVVGLTGAIFPDEPPLAPFRTEQGSVAAVEILNEYGEADWIIDQIEHQVGGSDLLKSSQHHADGEQRTFRDLAVLYRTHSVAKVLQRSLEQSGIPYQVAGEGSPYLHPTIVAITQALAYLAGEGEAPSIHLQKLKSPAPILNVLSILPDVIKALGIDTDKH